MRADFGLGLSCSAVHPFLGCETIADRPNLPIVAVSIASNAVDCNRDDFVASGTRPNIVEQKPLHLIDRKQRSCHGFPHFRIGTSTTLALMRECLLYKAMQAHVNFANQAVHIR